MSDLSYTEKPLVLLHGWGATPAIWQPLVEALHRHCPELEVMTLPWPGYLSGQEDTGPEALETADSLQQLADVMLPDLPRNAHWLGWSLGGNLALWLADYLSRTSSEQAHTGELIMLGSNACFAQREHWPHALDADVLGLFRQGFDLQPEKTLKRFHSLQMQGETDLRACKRAFTTLLGKDMPADNITLAAGLTWLAELDLTRVAEQHSGRLHWLLGEHDPLVPVQVAEYLPGQVEVLPDCGHLPMLTETERLAEQLLNILKVAS